MGTSGTTDCDESGRDSSMKTGPGTSVVMAAVRRANSVDFSAGQAN